MKPGDLVKVSETRVSYIDRVAGVDYQRRELLSKVYHGMMLDDINGTMVPVETLCTVLEVREIEIKYVTKVTQSNRRHEDYEFDYHGQVPLRHSYHEEENLIEYGHEFRTFAKVLTPKSIGWIRTDVLVLV
jgi:hypothetical protein